MNGLQLDSTTLIKLSPNTAANEGLWGGGGLQKIMKQMTSVEMPHSLFQCCFDWAGAAVRGRTARFGVNVPVDSGGIASDWLFQLPRRC